MIAENSTFKNQHSKFSLAVFASGQGTNAERLIQYFKKSPLATVDLIVCNKPGAGVLSVAATADIPVLMIEKENFFRGDAYLPQLQAAGIDFIILAGFLWKIPPALINAYPRKIVNIHPALLPKFGGRGMYGQKVHEAVLETGEKETGITIHYVDEHYDNGDVIFQTTCPVLPIDSVAAIAERIHQLEYQHFPQVIEKLLQQWQ